jgi:hypothetical protein
MTQSTMLIGVHGAGLTNHCMCICDFVLCESEMSDVSIQSMYCGSVFAGSSFVDRGLLSCFTLFHFIINQNFIFRYCHGIGKDMPMVVLVFFSDISESKNAAFMQLPTKIVFSYFAWRNTDKSKTVFHESIFDGIPNVPEADKEIIRNADEKPMVCGLKFFLKIFSMFFFFI